MDLKINLIWDLVLSVLIVIISGNDGHSKGNLWHDGQVYLPSAEGRCSKTTCRSIFPGNIHVFLHWKFIFLIVSYLENTVCRHLQNVELCFCSISVLCFKANTDSKCFHFSFFFFTENGQKQRRHCNFGWVYWVMSGGKDHIGKAKFLLGGCACPNPQ